MDDPTSLIARARALKHINIPPCYRDDIQSMYKLPYLLIKINVVQSLTIYDNALPLKTIRNICF